MDIFGFPEPVVGLDFCNVTIAYTHLGWGDTVNVISYLPLVENWNTKFAANGGGGFMTGGEEMALFTMVPALVDGFAVSTTDGGHRISVQEGMALTSTWAHSSPGNVNWPLLVDFAHVALHDMATIGKAVTEAFYQVAPRYSYFFGGSTGGRQGYQLAQRYLKDFDGILALFPAINWAKFLFSNIWPVFVMNQMNAYPPKCQFDAIREAAIAACDELDGFKDGIISRPGLCRFDPHTVVGRSFHCNDIKSTISSEAATIARAAWDGPRSSSGEFQWYGFGMDADLTEPLGGPIHTSCNSAGVCSASPFVISDVWARYWVLKQPDFEMTKLTHEEWDDIFRGSVNEYESVIGTSDPDLARFRNAGGKMITWHGTGDAAIPSNGSSDYYDRVLHLDPNAQDYYRLFMIPGSTHAIMNQIVPSRDTMFKAIQDWVEKGVAPDTMPSEGPSPKSPNVRIKRDFCMYPRVQHYQGGDGTKADSFICV
ncbi:putative feruloyl esterase b precursor protein [Rosellinia necatrix]|uniref:Carboxylic ester hydrolase n=1 Tax=Rosellinia necatrix TaxID=77044 RepID=A0A1W2TVK5_ROSNE|nr:putative feruloyl esterase b precursor protein [Rosellinia necatrix]